MEGLGTGLGVLWLWDSGLSSGHYGFRLGVQGAASQGGEFREGLDFRVFLNPKPSNHNPMMRVDGKLGNYTGCRLSSRHYGQGILDWVKFSVDRGCGDHRKA